MRQRVIRSSLVGLFAMGGCWQDELPQVPEEVVTFDPEGGDAPEGWEVIPLDVPLTCPDGEKARFWFVYPADQAGSATPMAAAVVYHSGAFDFVFAPQPGDPLDGTHYSVPSRIDSAWAVRRVFVILGMLPDEVADEVHTGVLPIALAEADVAMLLPMNCWGDWWHNRAGLADNDFAADLFPRDGRTAAEWGYQFLADPIFASAFGVELPVTVDTTRIYAVGLGDGGRAVTELLSIDADGDGVADHQPAGAIVDSLADDLSVYFEDPALFGNAVAGLSRVFPSRNVDQGSLATATLPQRFGYLYSADDPKIPESSHLRAMDMLLGDPQRWVYVTATSRHVLLNSDDLELARQAVSYLTTGAMPPAGDGTPAGG